MVRLFISGRHGDTKTNILSRCSHSWHSSQGLIYRPLGA
jgi:hypothetical protein